MNAQQWRRLGGTRLGMVEAAHPVDDNVVLLVVEAQRAAHRAAGGDLAEVEDAVEHRAVLAHVEALELTHVLVLRAGQRAESSENEHFKAEPRA